MTGLVPFSHPSGTRIGDLSIETDEDTLVLSGSIEMRRNDAGIAAADRLIAILEAARAAARADPEGEPTVRSGPDVANPFGS